MGNRNVRTLTVQTEAGPRTLRVGEQVRVMGVPPEWYDQIAPGEYDETTVILERCVGRVYSVADIDEYEGVWIHCSEDGSPSASWCDHSFRVDLIEIVSGGPKTLVTKRGRRFAAHKQRRQ